MPEGLIKVCTECLPLSSYSVRHLVHPVIEIDGTPHKNSWGTYTFPVAPGTHRIAVYYRWFFFRRCNLAESTVDVTEGQIIAVKYTPARTVFQAGRLELL